MNRERIPSPNQPYVKEFDVNGNLLNPIQNRYETTGQTRKERRSKEPRFHGESKNHHLTVQRMGKTFVKFHRVRQIIIDRFSGKRKTILHYLEK